MKTRLIMCLVLAVSVAQAQPAPVYQVDAAWPQTLPDNMILGQVSGIAVAGDDTVWVLHRPETLSNDDRGAVLAPPVSQCCRPAPAVLQIDGAGRLLQAWGGPIWDQGAQDWRQPAADWPLNEHGIFVDDEGFVWIGGNQDAGGRHIVVKYSPSGEHVLTIGTPGETGGSNDTRRLGRPADIAVDTAAQEVYIADGYLNRRIIVFDSVTGAYKRHWGAYGNRPDDDPQPGYQPGAEPAAQFLGPVHAVVLAADGLVYVADRTGNRVQVFGRDGGFVREALVSPGTLANGSVWDLALSVDAAQRWLFVADGADRKVWILDRSSLETRGAFGSGGRQAGQFDWLHNLAVDSAGNVYTAEVNNGRRIQKFSPR